MRISSERNPNILLVIIIMLSFFGGLIAAVVAINRVENYESPYYFVAIFGGTGLIVGIILSNKLKPYLAVNPRIKNNYTQSIINICIACIGLTFYLASHLNTASSTLLNCKNYQMLNKYRQKYRYGSPEINSIVINMNGEPRRLVTSRKFWYQTSIGRTVHICSYHGLLGFNSYEIVNDKY
jgi:hypothetical protein